MAAKCNIIEKVLAKLDSLRYGVSFFEDKAILENYAEFLNCESVDVVICNPSDCKNESIDYGCYFIVGPIRLAAIPTNIEISFTLDEQYIKDIYKYEWDFSPEIFTLIGTRDEGVLILSPKDGVDLGSVVASISVKVTNIDDCSYTKTCYYNKDRGMNCLPYVPCVNADNLLVTMNTTLCLTSSNLVVHAN